MQRLYNSVATRVRSTGIFLIALLLLFCSEKIEAKEKQNILWMELDYAPAYFTESIMKGKGFAQTTLKIFKTKLKKYSHKVTTVNARRMKQYLKLKDKIYCVPTMVDITKQLPTAILSKIVTVVPPAGIVVRKNEIYRFKTKDGTSVEKLLQNLNYKLGIISGGFFGKTIDALIEKHSKGTNVHKRAKMSQTVFYRMLLMNRVDYIIDYAFSYYFTSKELNNKKAVSLAFLPVIEAQEPLKGYTICNDTPESRVVMDEINKIIITPKYKKAVTNSVLSFLPENIQEDYRRHNMESIGK